MTPSPLSYKGALGRVIPLFLLCLFLAALLIGIFNDVYAFVKPEGEVTLTLSAPADKWELCGRLYECGVIRWRTSFYLYISKDSYSQRLKTLSGEWTLNTGMSYREITAEIFKN